MTHDEMMSLLANTLADAAGSSGCLPILDCFSPHPGEEVTVSIPMCDDTVDIVLEDLDFPHEWEELLENSGADTMGDLVDYLCYCSQNNISLAISPEDEEKLYATLIDVCYENMSYDRQVDFWRHVLETNSLVCEVKEWLCEKMRVEQSAYCLWLTAQPPEEILHHAYEHSVREDIILATEEMNLTPAQVRALLKSPVPLADVYKDFSKLETDYMSIVAQCVEDRADDLLKKEQQQSPPKVYRQSVTYAHEHGELQQYHASCHLNERCRDEIDAALAQRFDGMRLGAGAVEQVVAEYGLERTKYVLAAAIQTRDGDGRISRTNREWADSIRTIKDMDRRGFDRSCYYADLQAHTCLLDGFVNQVRKFEKAKAQPAQDTPER